MSNGYLVAAAADLTAAHEIAEGFGLDVIDASIVRDRETTSAALAGAANVGVLLSDAASQEQTFRALLECMAGQLRSAQLITADADARAAFAFLPPQWPVMPLDEARRRSGELLRRKQAQPPAHLDSPPLAETSSARPPQDEPPACERPVLEALPKPLTSLSDAELPPEPLPSLRAPERLPEPAPTLSALEMQNAAAHPQVVIPPTDSASPALLELAPVDATAFAPSKFRRSAPELVRIVVHQPKDLNAVIKAAKSLNPTAESASDDACIGAALSVALDVRGGVCEKPLQQRTWTGNPIPFEFSVQADANAKQVVILARVFVDNAHIGVLSLARKGAGPSKKPHGMGDRARLKRHKRVFLCYAGEEREGAAALAAVYERADTEVFWDSTTLKSGEAWHPSLRREIDRADLVHLRWSKAAADSELVLKQVEHALTRRRKHSGKPDMTVQMVDDAAPPTPPSLGTLGFGDFLRDAVAGSGAKQC